MEDERWIAIFLLNANREELNILLDFIEKNNLSEILGRHLKIKIDGMR